MSSRKVYITLLLTFFCLVNSAQNRITISGHVTDADGNPIPQATIFNELIADGTHSDNNGFYKFKIPKGKQILKISAIGYLTVTREINVNQSQLVDFTLKKNTVALETVHVLGKSRTEQVCEKVYSVQNIDIQSNVATLNSLSALVNHSSGIRIRQDGGVGSDFNLSINGLSGNAIRYFIDGIPLSALGSSVNLENLPVNLVERIEIYKGVVPIELGEDALGGAINIITKKNDLSFFNLSTSVGSFNTYKFNLNAQYINHKSGFTVRPSANINYSKNNYIMRDVEVWDETSRKYVEKDMRRFHDRYKSLLGQIELGYTNRWWADKAFIKFAYSKADNEIQTGQVQKIVIGDATRNKESFNVGFQYAKHNFLADNLSARFFLSHTRNYTVLTDTTFRIYAWDQTWLETSFSEVIGRGKSIRHNDRPQTIARSNFNYKINPNSTLNFNYMMNSVDNKREDEFDLEFIPTNDRLRKHVLGLSYNLKLMEDKLNTLFFIKDYIFHTELKQKDFYWITGINEINPISTNNYVGYGLGARFSILPELSIKASFENSVRLPNTREFLGNGQTIYPNFKLQPEKSRNVNIGAFGRWIPADNHRINYESNFFIRDVSDYIIRVILAERESRYENIGAALIEGVEGELIYNYNNAFKAIFNGTYINERNKTKNETTYNNRMPNRPWLYSHAELNWFKKNPIGLKKSKLKATYRYSYIHWFYLTWDAYGYKESKEIIPMQHVHDMALTYFFTKDRFSISVECNNLLDKKLYDNYMLQKPGRSIFTKLNIFLN